MEDDVFKTSFVVAYPRFWSPPKFAAESNGITLIVLAVSVCYTMIRTIYKGFMGIFLGLRLSLPISTWFFVSFFFLYSNGISLSSWKKLVKLTN